MFASALVCLVLGMAIPWDKIPWDKLIAFAEKMFAQCAAAGVPAAVSIAQMRNPTPRQRNRIERITERGCKRNGMSNSEWRRDKKEILAKVYEEAFTTTDKEAQQVIERVTLALQENPDMVTDIDEDDE